MKLLHKAQAVLALGVLSLAASAAATTTYSGSFASTVTDNDPAGVTSTISVADAGVISGITVGVVIDHTWVGDLIMTLTAPDGTVINLMDRPGAPDGGTFGTNLDITEINFDDAAALAAESIVADTDPTGLTVSPDDMLSGLIGSSVTGDWTLFISDNAGGDLNNVAPTWSLNIDAAPVPLPAAFWLMLSAVGGLRLMRRR